jgi:hypothetical protein
MKALFPPSNLSLLPVILAAALTLATGANAAETGRVCAVRSADALQAELLTVYRSDADFSAFAGLSSGKGFDEVFDSADLLFAAIQRGRCQAVVTDGATAAALSAALGREGLSHEAHDLRGREALIDTLVKQQGFSSRAGFEFARSVTPALSTDDVRYLDRYGVRDAGAFNAGLSRMKATGYSSQRTTSALLAFLDDEKIGATSGKSAVAVQQARAERARAEAATARRAELAEFPYVAFISCGMGGGHIVTAACFGDTDLEVRNGSTYGLYKIYSLDQAGVETGRGLMIKLRRSFSIRAQNSDDTLVLGVEVQDAATRKVLFQQQAGQFRTVRVAR